MAGDRSFLLTDTACVGRLSGGSIEAPEARTALIVRRSGLSSLRDQLPEPATLQGELTRLPPGSPNRLAQSRTQERAQGGRPRARSPRGGSPSPADELLFWRTTPLSPRFSHWSGNALPQPGDAFELWPSPALRRDGRLSTAVLAIQPHSEGALLTLAGTAEDGLVVGRLVDLYRKDEYVGVWPVSPTSANPLSVAQMIESASKQAAQVGDTAILRPSPTPPNKPLLAARVSRRARSVLPGGRRRERWSPCRATSSSFAGPIPTTRPVSWTSPN